MTTTARSRASYICVSVFTGALALGCTGTIEEGDITTATAGEDSAETSLWTGWRTSSRLEERSVRSSTTEEPAPAATPQPPTTGAPVPAPEVPEDSEESPEAPATPVAPAPVAEAPSTPAAGGECPDIGLDAPKVHYVCDCQSGAAAGCKPGSDANAGTQEAPWQSYSKAREAFGRLAAGETIAFCRGGSFDIEGDRRWTNASCKADEPCVVRDYVPSWAGKDAAKPILTAAEGDGFSFEDGAAADHEEGYTFLNLDLRSQSGGEEGNGFFVYNDVKDVLVCGASITGFGIGFHSAGSNAPASGSDGKNARVVVRSSHIANNGDQGYLGGCDGCGVEYSTFENNGFKQEVLNHNIYFSPRGADGMFARHNDLYRSAIIDGKCEAVSLVVHGQLTNLTIEGNTIREDIGKVGVGCWGIAVDSGYAGEAEGFEKVSIRGNTIMNVGNLGIGLNACEDCVIENNVVIQEQAMDSTLIAAPNRERNDNDKPLGSVTVRNNTLFARNANRVTGIALGGEATGHVAVSNALLSEGSGSFTCFDYDLGASGYAARDNNLCHGTKSVVWSTGVPALTTWSGSNAADAKSITADPMFVSTVAPYDFTPAPGSPLLDAGHSLSASLDKSGSTRDNAPDIGAVER